MVSIMRDARDRRGPTFDDIEATRAWLTHRPDCTGTVGRGAAARLNEVLTEVGVDHDVKEYRHAGHAFLNDRVTAGDRTPALFAVLGPLMNIGYEPDAAHDARTRILAFFDRHLKQDAAPPTVPGA